MVTRAQVYISSPPKVLTFCFQIEIHAFKNRKHDAVPEELRRHFKYQ